MHLAAPHREMAMVMLVVGLGLPSKEDKGRGGLHTVNTSEPVRKNQS